MSLFAFRIIVVDHSYWFPRTASSSSFMPSHTKTGSSRRLSPDSPPSLFGHVPVCWAHAGTPHSHPCVVHSRGRLGDWWKPRSALSLPSKKSIQLLLVFTSQFSQTKPILFPVIKPNPAPASRDGHARPVPVGSPALLLHPWCLVFGTTLFSPSFHPFLNFFVSHSFLTHNFN